MQFRYKGKYKQYDYVSDINDQVYEAASSESDLTTQAVIETVGEVAELGTAKRSMRFYFLPAAVLRAKCEKKSGKRSTPYSGTWQSLTMRSPGKNLCQESPHYRWRLNWTGEEIEN